MTEFPCPVRTSVVRAWPGLSRAHDLFCRVWHCFLSWPAPSRPKNPLSQQNFSLPWPTLLRHRIALSRHNFSLPWPTLSRQQSPCCGHSLLRHRTLCHDIESSYIQPLLSRHRKTLSRHGFCLDSYSLLRHRDIYRDNKPFQQQ